MHDEQIMTAAVCNWHWKRYLNNGDAALFQNHHENDALISCTPEEAIGNQQP